MNNNIKKLIEQYIENDVKLRNYKSGNIKYENIIK